MIDFKEELIDTIEMHLSDPHKREVLLKKALKYGVPAIGLLWLLKGRKKEQPSQFSNWVMVALAATALIKDHKKRK